MNLTWKHYLPLLLAPMFALAAAVFTAPLYPHSVAPGSFTVHKGDSLRAVLHKGYRDGVFRMPRFTEILLRVTGNASPKAGIYKLPESGSDFAIGQLLHRGSVETVKVTVLEGWTAEEIAAAVATAGVTTATDFLEATTNPILLRRYSIVATEVEGYLFPETYRFARDLDGLAVVDAMLETFFATLPDTYETLAEETGLTLPDAVILASVIQKESYIPDEMGTVSSVFHNRLNRSMKLQSDPTAIYRMPGYNGNLTRKHLRTATPYNTYVIQGLPAGPIGNPGIDALMAAVTPETTPYLYFVARQDGLHDFSITYREHKAKVYHHQIAPNRRK